MKYIHSLFPEVCPAHFLLSSVSQSRLHSLTVLVPALTTPPSGSFLSTTCFREHLPFCPRADQSSQLSPRHVQLTSSPSPAPGSPVSHLLQPGRCPHWHPAGTPDFTSSRMGLPLSLRIPLKSCSPSRRSVRASLPWSFSGCRRTGFTRSELVGGRLLPRLTASVVCVHTILHVAADFLVFLVLCCDHCLLRNA